MIEPIDNRPRLSSLRYRVGVYATFFESMLARLGSRAVPGLSGLTSRALDDPSIALLDGWAIVADVLTFYQERIANEGFLRTAAERRSVIALARLVGYALRPGVAATAYLAYTLEKTGDVVIPAGSKAQSVPKSGQLPQIFETAEPLNARYDRNTLGIRTLRPQSPTATSAFYAKGTSTLLKPNDPLLIVVPPSSDTSKAPSNQLVRVAAIEPQPTLNRSKVTLQTGATPPLVASPDAPNANLVTRFGNLSKVLLKAPSQPPRSPFALERSVEDALSPNRDAISRIIESLHPELGGRFYDALANAPAATQPASEVWAFRARPAPFGHNAPQQLLGYETQPPAETPPPPVDPSTSGARGFGKLFDDARRVEMALLTALHAVLARSPQPTGAPVYGEWPLAAADANTSALSLDARYDKILKGSYVAVKTFGSEPVVFTVNAVDERTRSDYGITGDSTALTLDRPFFDPANATLGALRATEVYAQSERIELVDVPIEDDVTGGVLELDALYDGIDVGRWAIVAGTRTDLPGVDGAERVMIAAVDHATNPTVAGDTVHTFVTLAKALAYTYRRSTVVVYGNVVQATHGETKRETLGSGDASASRQRFALKATPLTYVPAQTASGVTSTLRVQVNGVAWVEDDAVDAQGPADHAYAAQTDDAGVTTVVFGDGVHGARLPSGAENVTATYRAGIGTPGNVDAKQVSLLVSRPLGVKSVVNPLAAVGGADPETRNEARANVPTALAALDRLVSLQDYADFVRTFAGVGKADVARIGAGAGASLIVTIAGADDAPLDPAGPLAVNVKAALETVGDPGRSVAVVSRRRVILVLSATIDLAASALWDDVAPAIRAALNDRFAFSRRDFGQPAYKTEAIAAIAAVDGVRSVDVTAFLGVREETLLTDLSAFAGRNPAEAAVVPQPAALGNKGPVGAEIVAIDPGIPDTVILNAAGAASS
jgi:predicted phage baseplate assembly protein